MPLLGQKDIFRDEVLYSEGDGAEDIYFLLEGKIILYFDISELIELPDGTIEPHQGFNVPIIMYQDGSHFGDQECLTDRLLVDQFDEQKYYR